MSPAEMSSIKKTDEIRANQGEAACVCGSAELETAAPCIVVSVFLTYRRCMRYTPV